MQPQKPKLVSLRADADDPIMTVAEAAAYLRISKTQMHKLIRGKLGGPIPDFATPGRRITFRKSWLDEWMIESARQRRD